MKQKSVAFFLAFFLVFFVGKNAFCFGFYAHKTINHQAIFLLPPEMIGFYKKHIDYITEHATDPDKRSRSVEGEDVKHFIDIEHFGDIPLDSIPIYLSSASKVLPEDSIKAHGYNPYWIYKMYYSLIDAFKNEDIDKLLFISANIGHYIADACTPLHTTKFYDGKSFDQKGIHAFWETRIPEMHGTTYNYWLGNAEYIDKPQEYFWQLVKQSHRAVDTIFSIEEELAKCFPESKKYVYEEKGNILKRQYSQEYVAEFEKLSQHMVEKRMRTAIKAVADIWLTAWVMAGQPDLSRLDNKEISKQHQQELDDIDKMWKTGKPVGRPNPEDVEN